MTREAIGAARNQSERREPEQPEPGNKEILDQLHELKNLLAEIRDVEKRQLEE